MLSANRHEVPNTQEIDRRTDHSDENMQETEISEIVDKTARLKQLFLRVVEKGEKKGVALALEAADTFDVNCKDKDGRNALIIAMQNGNIEMMELLALHPAVHLGDILLRAVHSQNVAVIEVLCKALETRNLLPEGLNCHAQNDDFHEDMTPIILACHQNNYVIAKMLLDHGARIDFPDQSNVLNKELSLEQSIGTINIYRAVTSETYISLTSEDPIHQAFKLSAKMSQLSFQDFEFRSDYVEMADRCSQYAADLLDFVRNGEEQKIVMTDGRKGEVDSDKPAKVGEALKYEQKKFVAHSVCQQYLTEKWYDRFSRWRRQTDLEVFVQACFIGLCYPVFSLFHILHENSYLGKFLKAPYIKFIAHMASILTFLILLTLHLFYIKPEKVSSDSSEQGGSTSASLLISIVPHPVEILIIIWILALTWGNIRLVWSEGSSYLNYNKQTKILDTVTLALFWSWIILRSYAAVKTYMEDYLPHGTNITINGSLADPVMEYAGSNGRLCVIPPHGEDVFVNLVNEIDMLKDTNDETTSALECILQDSLLQLNDNMVCTTAEGDGSRKRRAARVTFRRKPSTSGYSPAKPAMAASLFSMSATHPILVAEGLFALAKVLSFLGLARMMVAHVQMGPMQISFGRMGGDIAKFLVIFALILVAFSVGMNQLYYLYSYEVDYLCQQGNVDAEVCVEQPYKSLLSSLAALFWTVFGMSDIRSLDMTLSDRWFTEVIANVLFALYQVLAVIVLLNILIAMMSNTYQRVADDEDMQWKFCRSLLWLSYYEETASLAPPFNLLPTVASIKRAAKRLCRSKRFCKKNKKVRNKCKGGKTSEYKDTIKTIVERYVFDRLVAEENPPDAFILQLKQDMFGFKDDMFSTLGHMDDKMSQIHHSVDETAEPGEKATMTDLMKEFSNALNESGPIRPEALLERMGEGNNEIAFAEFESDED
ncbi:short transient receptor potential channel 4-like [Ptychodera flava]|uniref:short transient receptor potential channel 4-like n=1 Tax=Ptychodera flava TaxID=63121 RepID=UPI00396A52BB